MNHTKFRFSIFISLFFITILLISINISSVAGNNISEQLLFHPTHKNGNIDRSDHPTILRARNIEINFELLNQIEAGGTIGFNLFPDTIIQAVPINKIAISKGGYAWTGNIEGYPLSQFTIVIQGGQIAANITMLDEIYQIRYAGNSIHTVIQIDQAAFPEDAPAIPVYAPGGGTVTEQTSAPQDDGSIIAAMVVYTPVARSAEGGTTAIQNLIDLAIIETNQSYVNSGITQRLNLVHTMEVNYTESGDSSTDLYRLRNPSDGFMDNVHPVRDTYAADVVTIIEEISDVCGVAYFMSSVSASFEGWAFSVVDRNCATGYYSYAHELGHNMSAHHDWYVEDSKDNPYSYNKGYINLEAGWRTIMAYAQRCADAGVSCPKIQYFSNPDVVYNGDPVGVPIGTSTACVEGDLNHPDCDADNRQTLNNTAYTVANFRLSGEDVGPIEFYNYDIDDDSSGNSIGDNDGIVECGETIELFVDIINQGADPAIDVGATISTNDQFATLISNTGSSYPNIEGSATGRNVDDFEIEIASNTPANHDIQIDLDITASNSGPWVDTFTISVACENNPPYIPATPFPANDENDVQANTDLSWSGGDPDQNDTITYDVYLEAGDNTPENIVCNEVNSTSCDPGMLTYSTQYYWFIIATDNHGLSTTGPVWTFRTENDPDVGPLAYEAHIVDDDPIGESDGNNDGILNCGDKVELFVDLRNQGSALAINVSSSLSTDSQYVQSTENQESNYPNIEPGATGRNTDDYEFMIASSTPDGYLVQFNLNVTASNGGSWTDSFEVHVTCDTIPASLPFNDGFESAGLGNHWVTHNTDQGRVQVGTVNPHNGSYSLVLDEFNSDEQDTYSAVILHLDLHGQESAMLGFWWLKLSDGNDFQDGIFIRGNLSENWCKVMSFSDYALIYTEAQINLRTAANNCGHTFSDDFQVKFQLYDDTALDMSGYAIDDVSVTIPDLSYVYAPMIVK